MSNVDINLIRARDGAAPQHKVSNANKFELSEGSDGAQHVKIVDSEGNVQDKIPVELPDKQIVTVDNQIQLPTDYPDKAVESRLQAIEQTQSQILETLNGTIDTRLTGSNAEKGIPVRVEKDVREVVVRGDELEAGKDQIFDIYADEGEMWTLQRFGYSTSRNQESQGKQSVSLYHGGTSSSSNYIALIEQDSSNYLQGTIPGWYSVTYGGDINPSESYMLVEALRGTTILSNDLPLRIRFRNQSDRSMSTRVFRLYFLVEKVNNIGR